MKAKYNKPILAKLFFGFLVTVWVVISSLFSMKFGRYLSTFSPTSPEGESSIDYYSEENRFDYILLPGEELSLPIRLEERISRIGIYMGEQEKNDEEYVFQLEDSYGSILGKTVTALKDIEADGFVYIPSRSEISSSEVYRIKIFADEDNKGKTPLHIQVSPANAFSTVPFSVNNTESESTLILEKRYTVNSPKIVWKLNMVLIAAVAAIWLLNLAYKKRNILFSLAKKVPWKNVNLVIICLLLITSFVIFIFPQKSNVVQYENSRDNGSRERVIPLTENTTVIQHFKPETGVFDKFGILFATYTKNIKKGVISVELQNDEDGSILYAGSLPTEKIADNEYQYFRLSKPLDLAGQQLRLTMKAEYLNDSDVIAVYADEDFTQEMFLSQDGEQYNESLIFNIVHEVGTVRVKSELVIISLIIIFLTIYLWAFIPVKRKIIKCAASSFLLSILFLPSILSLVNYKEISLDGMAASVAQNRSAWLKTSQYTEEEIDARRTAETEYDFKGEPFIKYEHLEFPINDVLSNIELRFRGDMMASKDYDIQIYWDTGHGYNSEQSYTYKYIHRGDRNLAFPIPCNEIVHQIMLSVGMTGDRFTGASLPDRILPLTEIKLNTNSKFVCFISFKTVIVFIGVFTFLMLAHLWKYTNLDEKISKLCNKRKLSISLVFLVVSLAFGITMSFLIPTWQVPDETAHVSMLYSDMRNGISEKEIIDTLGDQGLQNVMLNGGKSVDYPLYFEASIRKFENLEFTFAVPSIRVLRRPGQAIGVFLGHLFNLPVYWILQLGEIGALIVYSVVGAFTLKIIPYKKNLMMLIMLLPVAMQEAGSFAYDSFNNAISFLTIAYILHLKVQAKRVAWKQVVNLVLLAVLLLVGKVIYVLLLGLVLTVPIYKLDLKVGGKKPFSINEVWLKRHWIGVVITLLIGMALCIAGGLAFVNTLGYGDIGKLLWEYISSFSQLVRLWIVTCCVHWRTWIKGAIAALGNYDVFPNDIITWIGVSSAFIFALMNHRKASISTFTGKEAVDGHFSKWDIFVWYGLFCVLVVTVLMTMIEWGFFIYGIDPSLPYSATMRLLPRIEGVQGRYFYPILPLLFIPLHTKKDYLKFIPSYLYKICYYLLMTIYPISVLLERYWGV